MYPRTDTSPGHPDEAASPHALAARAEKRRTAAEAGVDEAFVEQLVETFYATIRADALLGPIFEARIADWPEHLGRMKRFWRSILFSSGEYSGNPMMKHLAIPQLEIAHYAHWLELFYRTLADLAQQPEAVELVGARARAIADSLLTGQAMQRDGLGGANAGKDLPYARQ